VGILLRMEVVMVRIMTLFILLVLISSEAATPRCDPPARWVCEGKKCRCVASAISESFEVSL